MNCVDDYPRSLNNLYERDRRRAMLSLPHISPLEAYAENLRRLDLHVPSFDPLDGGIDATILFLFEKPGPMTDLKSGGSGFISRNNDDPTAHATFEFMRQTGIERHETIIWNYIPWWNRTRQITRSERDEGRRELPKLLVLLPNLLTVVLVGRTAQAAWRDLEGLNRIDSLHPSPIVRATRRSDWEKIGRCWARAKQQQQTSG